MQSPDFNLMFDEMNEKIIDEKLQLLGRALLRMDNVWLKDIGLSENEGRLHIELFLRTIKKGERDPWNYGPVDLVTKAVNKVCDLVEKKGLTDV